jgi:hypothetical protein
MARALSAVTRVRALAELAQVRARALSRATALTAVAQVAVAPV